MDMFENWDVPRDIDAVIVSTNSNQKYLAPIISEMTGITPRMAHTVENMCSSGATAMVSAISYIGSGLAGSVLVVGADRYDSPGGVLDWDVSRGQYLQPVFWASLLTAAYKRRFGATDRELAAVSAKNLRSARHNRFAPRREPVGIDDILESRRITDDLRLYNCAQPCTGAAAILLTGRPGDGSVSITGIGHGAGPASFAKSQDLSEMGHVRSASREALKMSCLEPDDIDVLEVHDAFSVCEPMALEAAGVAKKGGGARYCADLYESRDSRVNPRGGLIGAGHPLGATGVAQAVEIAQQLQGRAGDRQVGGARRGLVQSMSAAATSSTVMVLES